MGKVRHFCWVIVAVLGSVGDTLAAQGAITGLTLSPAAAEVGVTVSATATGSAGPCGAVHIDWGDGNAITYATVTLPVTQTHVYKAAGTFNLRAQGMGNCTGEAKTRIVITAPPPPPPPPAAPPLRQQITGLSGEVPAGASPSVRRFLVQGRGRCSYVLDFGDGNSESRDAELPDRVRHSYPADGRYTAVATARQPCSGVMRFTFIVGRPSQAVPPPPSISRVDVRPQVARIGQRIALTVAGSGTCTFVVNFGDGESRSFTERLPYRVSYRYAKAGDFEIMVSTPGSTCTGGGDAVLRIRR